MRYLYTLIWALSVVYILFVIFQPIGIQAQGVYAIFALCCMAAIHILGLKGISRHILLAVGCTVALRYLYWRTTSTLPDADDLVNFIPGIALLVAEFYAIGMLFLCAFISVEPLRRKKIKLTGDPSNYPTVDVLVPSYNENDDIVGHTLAAVRNLKYPADKLNIYLLDDGATFEKTNSRDDTERRQALERQARLREFCKDLGVHYLAREKNEHAKAGNLNFGLENSSGDFVLVLDADHAPVSDFLLKTMGYMQQDESLYLVQTPHFFLNSDPFENNLGVENRMPSENEMFYSVTQNGFEKWNASFFCGSAAVMRRKALEEVGGFKGDTITEDCETALELHARGWSSTYIDEPMIAGLQPETVQSFLTQRSRWCQGMVQILLLKMPFWKRGLSFMQRLSYLSSMMFWLFPFSRLVFTYFPALFVFFDLQFYNASTEEILVYTLIYIFTSAIMQNYMYGSSRWPLMSETYEYIQSHTLARVIFSTIINPRKPKFKVTDKGVELKKNFFSSHGWGLLLSHIFLTATFVYCAYRLYHEADASELLYMVTFWCFFNMVISGIAFGVCAEKLRPYRYYRIRPAIENCKARLTVKGLSYRADILDISMTGIRIELTNRPTQKIIDSNAQLEIDHPELGDNGLKLKVLINPDFKKENERTFVSRFIIPGAADRRKIAQLMLTNNQFIHSNRERRQNYRSLIMGCIYAVSLSFKQTLRGIGYAFTHVFRLVKREGTTTEPSIISGDAK